MNTHILYHRPDLDGMCSREVVCLYLQRSGINKANVTCIGVDYNDDFDTVIESIPPNVDVFLADFSFIRAKEEDPCRWMRELVAKSQTLTWIDHHETAIVMAEGQEWAEAPNVKKYLDSSRAACEIAWDVLMERTPKPPIVYHLGRYDVWDHSHPLTKIIQEGFFFTLKTSNDPDSLWKDALLGDPSLFESVAKRGTTLELKMQMDAQMLAPQVQVLNIPATVLGTGDKDVLTVLVLNDQMFTSRRFEGAIKNLEKEGKSADLMVMFALQQKQGKPAWRMGLYSTNPQVNCAAIAQTLGGGGHHGAAGTYTTELPDWLKEALP